MARTRIEAPFPPARCRPAVPLRAVLLGAVLLAGCHPTPPPPQARSTIKEIMTTMVDPSADTIWQAVGTIETAAGTTTAVPRTGAEWSRLRAHARTLVRAGALLSAGPAVVPPGDAVADADTPGTRTAAEIARDIARDPARFQAVVAVYTRAASALDAAVAAHAPDRVLAAGEALDHSCDTCHFSYWHPRGRPAKMPSEAVFARSAP